jgi:hypothetical protein
MDANVTAFIDRYPDAAMITLRRNGSPHMARIEVVAVDGRIWATGSPSLVRTKNVRRDPRSSLFVFGPHPYWLGLETEVKVLEGPDTPRLLLKLMRARHKDNAPDGMVLAHDEAFGGDRPFTEAEYLEHVRAEQRLIYEFHITRTYGNTAI